MLPGREELIGWKCASVGGDWGIAGGDCAWVGGVDCTLLEGDVGFDWILMGADWAFGD